MKMYHENAHILEGESIQSYIEGGHAIVTLESPSGKHYTYSFKKPFNTENKYSSDLRFVKVHIENDWVYIGTYRNKYMSKFNKTEMCLLPDFHEAIKGVNYIMRMCNEPDLDTPMKLYHEGVCCRCGRPLTDPKSIISGIGPKCSKM